METILTLLVFVPIAVIVFLQYRGQRDEPRKLAASLGARDIKSDETCSGETEGLKYSYRYHAGSRYSYSYFKVWIGCPRPGRFEIRKQGRFDSIFKALGIAVEIETGDSDFDRAYYIQTDFVELTRTFLASADTRQSIEQLFALGYNRVIHDSEGLEAQRRPFSAGAFKAEDLLESTAKELDRLSAAMPEEAIEYRAEDAPSRERTRHLVRGAAITSAVAGGVLYFWAGHSYQPLAGGKVFSFSLHYAIPAFILFMVVAVLCLKGRSSSHRELLFVFLVSAIGFPLSGYYGAMAINGYFDAARAESHRVGVFDKLSRKTRYGRNYYVDAKSWRRDRFYIRIPVSYDLYKKVKSRRTLVVVDTKPGDLGFEWLVACRISKTNK